MGVRRNFSRGEIDIFLILFRFRTIQRKRMYTKRFALSTPQRKYSMLRQRLRTVLPLRQLCPNRGLVEGFVRPSLVFAIVSCILTTCPCFSNLEFDIFDAGGPQCHFITSVTIAVRIRTFSVYQFKLNYFSKIK